MRKRIVTVIFMGLLLTSLTACNNKGEVPAVATTPTVEDTEYTAEDKGESVILFIGNQGDMKDYKYDISGKVTPEL